MDMKVDEYIEKLGFPRKEICIKLREILLKTYPDIIEEMKWGVPTYLRDDGGQLEPKYYFVALKDKVNLGFSIKGLSKDQIDLLDGTGKEMRHIKIFSTDDLDEERVVKLLEMAE